MIEPRLEWLLPEPFVDPPPFDGFGAPVSTLLARRGFRTDAALRAFLEAGAGALHDVSRMADAPAAIDRIDRAVAAGERIAIWGDYDADGMTAVATWTIALRELGVDPVRHVPSRLTDGYGLSESGLRELAAQGIALVITCDCGVTNVDEVEVARGLGIDVVVTDHHQPPAVLPRAVAVVDPHRPDCQYPDPELTGAGLSYKLASALLARHGRSCRDLAGVAAIGTVADLAPMTGESRAIVRLGLEELGTSSRPGIRALLRRAVAHPERPTSRDLAFAVAPRINAAGRIAEASLAISLLVEEDGGRAEALADELEELHRRRRELSVTIAAEAAELVPGTDDAVPLVLRNDGWPAGMLGLVAGRLCDQLARPVVVAALVGVEVRGSVRTPRDVHAALALGACAAHLTKRGGHAAAGGFSLAPERWDDFRAAFTALPRPFPDANGVRPDRPDRLPVDLVVPARYLDWTLLDEIERLAPFGPGHVEPMLAVTGLRVGTARRVGAAESHITLRMLRGNETVDAIAFGVAADRGLPVAGDAVDLVGTLERDMFQGHPRLRLRVADYADASASPLLGRRRVPVTVQAAAAAAVA